MQPISIDATTFILQGINVLVLLAFLIGVPWLVVYLVRTVARIDKNTRPKA